MVKRHSKGALWAVGLTNAQVRTVHAISSAVPSLLLRLTARAVGGILILHTPHVTASPRLVLPGVQLC
jgi:hypothetical protein